MVNPIKDMNLPRPITKDVYFLEPHHIERLFRVQLERRYHVALWWFKMVCLTGLDLPDAVRYTSARALYETVTPKGNPKIVIRRSKPPKNECNIPVTTRLIELWDEVGGQAPPPISNTTMINHLEVIAEAIGFTKRLTPKIGRKTAGTLFLRNHSIKAVSNILGHASIGTTERFYCKVTGYQVDHEMDAA